MRGRLSTPSAAGGYSATADAFARDPDTGGLWFLSMVGPQTALKAIWASLLKQPPDTAHLIKGVEGMALSGGYQQCQVPSSHRGNLDHPHRPPARKPGLARPRLHPAGGVQLRAGRLPAAGPGPGRRAGAAPPLPGPAQPPAPAPLLAGLALAKRGLDTGETVPLESAGLLAYTCNPKGEELKADLSAAVAAGTLTLNATGTRNR